MYIYVWALLFARLPGWKVCVLRWRGVFLSVMRVLGSENLVSAASARISTLHRWPQSQAGSYACMCPPDSAPTMRHECALTVIPSLPCVPVSRDCSPCVVAAAPSDCTPDDWWWAAPLWPEA